MARRDNIAWSYDCNEASGSMLDAAGGNTLTDNNTVTSTTGLIGNARVFTRANSEFQNRADNAALSMGNIDMFIVIAVKLTSKTGTQVIVNKGNDVTSTTTLEFALYYSSTSDRFVWRVRGGATNTQVNANNFGSPSTGVWYIIMVRHNPTTKVIGIRVNNGTEDTNSHTTGIADGTGDFRFGNDNDASRYADVTIDNAHCFKRAPTADDPAVFYNGGRSLAYPFDLFGQRINDGLINSQGLINGGRIAA